MKWPWDGPEGFQRLPARELNNSLLARLSHIRHGLRTMSEKYLPTYGAVSVVFSLVLGLAESASTAVGGYTRVADLFPYPVMTHSQF